MSSFARAYIERRIEELSPWYHSIDLGDGIVTPGRDYDRVWGPIRSAMDALDYKDKAVLDIASWDGMWAFEAERRGARHVVATDVRVEGAENLLFCKQILGSKVFPLFNAQIQDLPERLKVVKLERAFDIVQHLGLFYHLRDPLLSLTQARVVMKEGGLMILETAYLPGDERPVMYFNGIEGGYHWGGSSDIWAPTKRCLEYLLIRSKFEPVMQEHWCEKGEVPADGLSRFKIGRICVIAKAVSGEGLHKVDHLKIDGEQ